MGEDINTNAFAIEIQQLAKSFNVNLALKGIDLKLANGECLVVFGPNGAGKTTLIKILATLSRPSKGNVFLAGLDISKDAIQIRRQIGVVSHQTFLYDNLTAYENLKFYGKMYDVPSLEQRIFEVIDQVELRSRMHDRVGVFSRGMQQRLSIARAILSDPCLLILDEATASVDTRTEAIIQKALEKLLEGRTSFVIAHRLSTVRKADIILVLEEGRIVESGNHKDLMEANGLYADLYNRQFYIPEAEAVEQPAPAD